MPLYEYECQNCRGRVEILQRVSDRPYSHCPKCGGEMKKLFSSPAIQFKGSGFYKTDYAKSGGSSKSDTKSESNSESKSDTKSDTKSETKSDSGSTTKSE